MCGGAGVKAANGARRKLVWDSRGFLIGGIMEIVGLDISNFKGVRSANIRFSENDIARVHTLVGLNESGKTTLLEAMHSFSPDAETELVVKSAHSAEEQREHWVPRDKISIFSGEVSITAHVRATKADWDGVKKRLDENLGLVVKQQDLPDKFIVKLVHLYKKGDFVSTKKELGIDGLEVKSRRAKEFRPLKKDERAELTEIIWRMLPTIAYYPTFVFDFPKKIYLTNRDISPRNKFYQQLFQDILDYDGNGYTIKESILERLHKAETQGAWESWFGSFVGTSEEDKVKQVISRAERAVTKLVFSKWNEVFGEKFGSKTIEIDLQYEKGKALKLTDGTEREATRHDAYIRFRIKDGSNIYSVEDRSLGFRWFFSFLLFTQFRIHRERQRATIFLFDEPASNLHAAAQKKLLESFPAIAKAPHRLIYSTHSHYMVEPRWLEQAYIVFDKSSAPDSSIIDAGIHEDSTVDVQAVPYRQFVQEHPNKTSYFQPILDTLEVRPSSFDYKTGGLIVEGKSDFYFIKYACLVLQKDLGPIFPARGAGTLGAMVSLHRGWALPVRVLFDSDRGGKDGKTNLVRDFSIQPNEFTELSVLVNAVTHIEGLIDEGDQERLIGQSTGNKKLALLRVVQEHLAAGTVPKHSKETRLRMTDLLSKLDGFISGKPG
jgi:energy-coupling factor transporter ATP-binding protein EcfA2